jgi:hypothetical protein
VVFFLGDHAAEDLGGGWVVGFEILGQIGLDSGVFLFLRDGEGEDFFFGEAVEGAHGKDRCQVSGFRCQGRGTVPVKL